jgi:large conductance mechanosensitive channel
MVTAIVTDLINPLIGLALGGVNLKAHYLMTHGVKLMWGDFLSVFVDFLVVALVVYFGVKWLRLDKLDRKK